MFDFLQPLIAQKDHNEPLSWEAVVLWDLKAFMWDAAAFMWDATAVIWDAAAVLWI